jgi:putative PIN family toxin of toxin-antitoxin system
VTDRPRVVFDCNIFLQAAAREQGAAAKCLDLAEDGRVQLFVSREVLAEVEDVLNRPEIRAHFPNLSDEIVGAFLKRLRTVGSAAKTPLLRAMIPIRRKIKSTDSSIKFIVQAR